MDRILLNVSRNARFQDAIGVLRGISRVSNQIVKRSKFLEQDLQNISKAAWKDLSLAEQSVLEFSKAFNSVSEIMKEPEVEFVTFEQPKFDYQQETLKHQEKNQTYQKDHTQIIEIPKKEKDVLLKMGSSQVNESSKDIKDQEEFDKEKNINSNRTKLKWTESDFGN